MKLKPFNPKKTPMNKLLLVALPNGTFEIAEYRKQLQTSPVAVWVFQYNKDYSTTKDTYWCELPKVEGEQRA